MSNLNQFFNGGFNTSSVAPQEDFEVIPAGKYPVLVEKAEVKTTKAGNGHFIALTLQILDGPYKGRKLFDNINIQNASQKAEEIALRTLAALGLAIGLQAVTDTDQLLNQVVIASVKAKDGDNSVRTYLPVGQQAQAPQAPQYQPPQAPANQYAPPPQYGPPAGYQPPQNFTAPPQNVPWARK
jgi:hypothetical protein